MKRLKEINSSDPYKRIGPWSLVDFRQVRDWREVEHNLHYRFRSRFDDTVENQRELFRVSPREASNALGDIDPENIVGKPKIDRMFQDERLLHYLARIFTFAGLLNWLDIQGAWTFTLFPATNGGRYFTISIGPHEVAFSTLGRKGEPQFNMILVDELILDFRDTTNWLVAHDGGVETNVYSKALSRAASLYFLGPFEEVVQLFELDGMRRALIAYWNDALVRMKENGTTSVFSRYHNWNAVSQIRQLVIEMR